MRNIPGAPTRNAVVPLALALTLALPAVFCRTAFANKPADFGTIGGSSLSNGSRESTPLGGETVSATQAITNVVVCGARYDQSPPVVIRDGDGGAIAVWSDLRSGNLDCYAQKLDEGGNPRWPADGVPACKAAGDQTNPQVITDGAGGLIAVWQDNRYGTADIYAQRVNVFGVTVWSGGGVSVCNAANAQREPVAIPDGMGGVVVAWVDERGADADIYVQRLNAAGVPQWTANGVALCTATGAQERLAGVSDGLAGGVFFWEDRRGADADIYARGVNAAGAPQWAANGVLVSGAPGVTGAQETPAAISDGAGGTIVTWTDKRGATYDIYAQRLNGAGTAQWTPNGVLLCGAAGDQKRPQLCTDAGNGALVVWEDRRGATADVYARRVSGAGVAQWAADGIGVCTATADQLSPAISLDPTDGAVVAWSDARTPANGQDIYVQHLQSNGTNLWTASGVLICDTAGSQDLPGVVVDGLGGAVAIWRDYRAGVVSDLYSQRVNSSGQVASQCAATVDLVPDAINTTTSDVHFYDWHQLMLYWSAVGVRPASGSDWDIEVYEPFSFGLMPYPNCFRNPFAGSFRTSGVDFVMGNFNLKRTPINARYGVRASRYTGTGNAVVEWDDLDNIIDKDCTGGNCGAKSVNNWTGVIDVWDVYLFEGQTYTFDFTKTGSADIKFLLFYAPGTVGTYFTPRSERVIETTSRYTVFQAPATAWYGVAMVNDNGLAGTYTTKVFTGALIGVGDGPPVATGIRGVAPNPSRGDVNIQFAVTADADVSFQVLDMAGRRVGAVPSQRWGAGSWSVRWDGSGTGGRSLGPGVYFVQMKVDGRTVGQSRLALIR